MIESQAKIKKLERAHAAAEKRWLRLTERAGKLDRIAGRAWGVAAIAEERKHAAAVELVNARTAAAQETIPDEAAE